MLAIAVCQSRYVLQTNLNREQANSYSFCACHRLYIGSELASVLNRRVVKHLAALLLDQCLLDSGLMHFVRVFFTGFWLDAQT